MIKPFLSGRLALVANLAHCESQTLAVINFPGKKAESPKSCIDLQKNVLKLRDSLSRENAIIKSEGNVLL